jgi:hypothetical protein
MAEGFLGRWSQRKQAVREGKPMQEPAAPTVQPLAGGAGAQPLKPVVGADQHQLDKAAERPQTGEPPESEAVKLPTLEDVQTLTPQSDFSAFVAREVPSDVRNAAMKKLFADPHYSLIDGMDIYLEDYSLPSPLSAAVMAKMASAQFLKLVDDPEAKKESDTADASAPAETDVAAAPTAPEGPLQPADPEVSADPKDHDNPDLRLQPNHAAVAPDTGRGTE